MNDEAALDVIFGALAHRQRRCIAALLRRKEQTPLSAIASRLELSPVALSKHLRRLRDARLIVRSRQDGFVSCRKSETGLATLNAWLAHVLGPMPAQDMHRTSLDGLYRLLSDRAQRRLLEHPGNKSGCHQGRAGNERL